MRNDGLPAAISQMIEALNDKSIPEHIRFNYSQTLKNVVDSCSAAIKAYETKNR